MPPLPPVIAILLVLASPAFAQNPPAPSQPTHPDLSGTSVFNSSKSQPAEKAATRTETLEIARSGQSIRIRFRVKGGELTLDYVPDGRVHLARSDPNGTSSTYCMAQWIGSMLVADRRTHLEGTVDRSGQKIADVVLVEHWNLSSDGRVLTRLVDQPGADHQILVYDKQ